VKAPANCRLIGRWRIVEADLWDRAHLDLCGPARLTITAQGGEIAFGALEAGLEVEYARDSIGFHWAGCEEGDEVDGEGTAELLNDGSIEIEFEYRNGDEAVLKAKRDTSQQPASLTVSQVGALATRTTRQAPGDVAGQLNADGCD
jgi:acylphosphatase